MAATAWRASASALSMAPSTSSLSCRASPAKPADLRQPAVLELGEPEVLRQSVVDLTRQPGPLLERGGRQLGIAEAAQLDVRLAQCPQVVAAVDHEPDEQHDVEGEPHAGRPSSPPTCSCPGGWRC